MANTENKNDVVIRDAKINDVSLLLSLATELSEDEKARDSFAMTKESLEQSLFGENAVADALIVEHHGNPAGFAFYSQTLSIYQTRTLFLESIYIRPYNRRKGLGRLLVENLYKKTLEKGCGRFWGFTYAWNKPAIAFYQSLQANIKKDWAIFCCEGDSLKV